MLVRSLSCLYRDCPDPADIGSGDAAWASRMQLLRRSRSRTILSIIHACPSSSSPLIPLILPTRLLHRRRPNIARPTPSCSASSRPRRPCISKIIPEILLFSRWPLRRTAEALPEILFLPWRTLWRFTKAFPELCFLLGRTRRVLAKGLPEVAVLGVGASTSRFRV